MRDGGRGHELAMALREAYLAMHRRTDAALAAAGVTADQFVVLAALAGDGASSQRDLVGRTASDPNTLRAMLVLLERRGLVERRPHPTDGRARSVALTPLGRTTFRRLWRLSAPLRAEMLTALGPPGAAALTDLLRRLASALEAGRTAARPIS